MFFRVATHCNISFVERGYSFLQMCSKAEPFKTETLLLLGTLKLPVKNSKDYDGEIEREMFK